MILKLLLNNQTIWRIFVKLFIIFYDLIANIFKNEKPNTTVTELFIRGKYFSSLCYTILICCTKKYQRKFWALFYYENSSKQELQQIAFNHSSDIDFQDFANLCEKTYSFLVTNTILASDNPLRFRKNLLERILKTNHDNR